MELVQRAFKVPAGESVVLAPLGDIQYAGRPGEIAWDALKAHISRAMDRKAWFVGMGDYLDFSSPSNRQRLLSAALYDTALNVIDDKARDLVDRLYDEVLAPTEGRWLGLLEGHHWTQLQTGETTDQYLCQKLKAPFLGTCAYLGLQFPTSNGTRTVNCWCHHGSGGGTKAHAPLLKLENLTPYWEADLFLVGHMTKQAVAPISRIHPTWSGKQPTLQEGKVYLVGTGGWLKGYAEGTKAGQTPRGGYVEQRMLNPVALGAPLITIRPYLRSDDTRRQGPDGHRDHAGYARYWEPEIRVEV